MPLNRPVDVQFPELVFGLVAPIGVDLDLVMETLRSGLNDVGYVSDPIRLTELMSALIEHEDIDTVAPPDKKISVIESYKHRIQLANRIRGDYGDDAILAKLAISAIRSIRRGIQNKAENAAAGESRIPDSAKKPEEQPLSKHCYIIRQIKRPEEVSLLRSVYGRQFILVSAYAPQNWRIKKLERQESESRGGLITDIQAHNSASEIVMLDSKESMDKHGQNVRDAFPLGDVFIDATSRERCEGQMRRFINLFFGNNHVTPNHDEYGIYLAKSASLRSSDLSRQVGAAIFRPSGEILTLGCNEVPKAGGGTYWTGDTGDLRDFELGADPNETRKTQVLVDLIDRLRKGGHLSQALSDHGDSNEISKHLLEDTNQDSVSESKIMDLLEFGRVVHAEMSALSDAARKGIPVEGATLYCTTFPCHLCAKLIVAAGIKKVVYLEPYPKSYASDLHGDAIVVDSGMLEGKVCFNAFIGISPFRYRDLFEKKKRKGANGMAQRWQHGEPRPMLNLLHPSYFEAETHVVIELAEARARLPQGKRSDR